MQSMALLTIFGVIGQIGPNGGLTRVRQTVHLGSMSANVSHWSSIDLFLPENSMIPSDNSLLFRFAKLFDELTNTFGITGELTIQEIVILKPKLNQMLSIGYLTIKET